MLAQEDALIFERVDGRSAERGVVEPDSGPARVIDKEDEDVGWARRDR